MKLIRIPALCLLLLLINDQALADRVLERKSVVAFAGEVELGRFWEINQQTCVPGPRPHARVSQQPKKGTITISEVENTNDGQYQPNCRGVKHPAISVVYKPDGKESGTDQAVYEVIYSLNVPALGTWTATANIEIQAP